MLRLSGLSLPLDHEPETLPLAICARLGVPRENLRCFTIGRRGDDAPRHNAILPGYAGSILSAAIDGIKVVDAAAKGIAAA